MNKDEFQNTSSGNGRKLFLVVVLLAVLAAFGYDYLVAKPAFQEGFNKLQSMQDPKKENDEAVIVDGRIVKLGDLDGDGFITQDDVHKMMDREPSATETPAENTVVETYSWPRGIPLMTYNAYVVYSKGSERTTFYSVTERKPGQDDYRKSAAMTPREDRPEGLGRAGNPAADKAAKEKEDEEKADEDKAAEDKSGDEKSAEDKAAEDKAAEDKAAEDKAAEDKAAEDKADDGGDGSADDGNG